MFLCEPFNKVINTPGPRNLVIYKKEDKKNKAVKANFDHNLEASANIDQKFEADEVVGHETSEGENVEEKEEKEEEEEEEQILTVCSEVFLTAYSMMAFIWELLLLEKIRLQYLDFF